MSSTRLYLSILLAAVLPGIPAVAQVQNAQFNQVINLNGDMQITRLAFPDKSMIETFSQKQNQLIVNQNPNPLPASHVVGSTGQPFVQLSSKSTTISTNGAADLVGGQIELPIDPAILSQNNVSADNTFVAKLSDDRQVWVIMEGIKSVNTTDNTVRMIKLNNIDGEYIAVGRQTTETSNVLTPFGGGQQQSISVTGSGIQELEFVDGFRMSIMASQPMTVNTDVKNGISSSMMPDGSMMAVNNYRYLVTTSLAGVVANLNQMTAVVQLPISADRVMRMATSMGLGPSDSVTLGIAQRPVLLNPGGAVAGSLAGQSPQKKRRAAAGRSSSSTTRASKATGSRSGAAGPAASKAACKRAAASDSDIDTDPDTDTTASACASESAGATSGATSAASAASDASSATTSTSASAASADSTASASSANASSLGATNSSSSASSSSSAATDNTSSANSQATQPASNAQLQGAAATQLLLAPTFTPLTGRAVLDVNTGRIAIPVSQLDGEFVLTMSKGGAAQGGGNQGGAAPGNQAGQAQGQRPPPPQGQPQQGQPQQGQPQQGRPQQGQPQKGQPQPGQPQQPQQPQQGQPQQGQPQQGRPQPGQPQQGQPQGTNQPPAETNTSSAAAGTGSGLAPASEVSAAPGAPGASEPLARRQAPAQSAASTGGQNTVVITMAELSALAALQKSGGVIPVWQMMAEFKSQQGQGQGQAQGQGQGQEQGQGQAPAQEQEQTAVPLRMRRSGQLRKVIWAA